MPPDYVWAVKEAAFTPAFMLMLAPQFWLRADTELRRWDGSNWSTFVPQPPFLGGLNGTSPDDIWISNSLGSAKSIAHFDGVGWTDVSPVIPNGGGANLRWVSGPRDAWLTAAIPQPPTPELVVHTLPAIYHWDGAVWTQVPTPIDATPDVYFASAWGISAQDIWIAAGSGGGEVGFLMHWDGRQWTRHDSAAFGPKPLWITSVWGASGSDVWAAGGAGSLAVIWHFDGTTWTRRSETASGLSGTAVSFGALWGTCATNIWMVGGAATSTGDVPVWHYDGETWAQTTLNGRPFGSGPDDLWRVSRVKDPVSGVVTSSLWHAEKDRCGNGVIGPTEQCDPPHQGPDGPQCDSTCHLPTCGNGVIDPGEQCDPPRSVASGSTPACDQACQIPTCGNLIRDPGETCDPPDDIICDRQCQEIPIVCGNGIVQPGESCEFPNGLFCQNCQTTTCRQCFDAAAGAAGSPVCRGLNAEDAKSCAELVNCLANNVRACSTLGMGFIGCYCLGPCPTVANGACASQFEALAHTHDPAAVINQIMNQTAPLANVSSAMTAFVNSSRCRSLCSLQ